MEIHKLAGHLLFENGAFEDALQAYKQGEMQTGDT
jgi:tetratricopeptide (TPR) repeat protein